MNNLDLLMGDLNKKYKDQILVKGTSRLLVDKIQFSSPRMNYLTYGGVPVGKVTEFFGPEGSGKTTSAIDITKQAQHKAKAEYDAEENKLEDELEILQTKNNKSDQKRIQQLLTQLDELREKGPRQVVYIDAENTFDEEWARLNGVDTDILYLLRPMDQTAEQVLQIIIDVVKTGNVILVVLDSVPMLVPQAIYEENMEKKSYCGVAGPMAIFSARIPPMLTRYQVALIMINQVREDMKNPYNLYDTPGGRALKHLYALRMLFRKGVYIDEKNEELKMKDAGTPSGNLVMVDIAKTKVNKPDRRLGFYTLNYTYGIDVLADTVDLAIKYGYIMQSGAWFNIMEDAESGAIMQDADGADLKFQGRVKLLDYLRNETVVFDELLVNINSLVLQ